MAGIESGPLRLQPSAFCRLIHLAHKQIFNEYKIYNMFNNRLIKNLQVVTAFLQHERQKYFLYQSLNCSSQYFRSCELNHSVSVFKLRNASISWGKQCLLVVGHQVRTPFTCCDFYMPSKTDQSMKQPPPTGIDPPQAGVAMTSQVSPPKLGWNRQGRNLIGGEGG